MARAGAQIISACSGGRSTTADPCSWLLGMYVFHHKTQKPKFTIGIPLILAAQLLIICVSFTQAAAFHNCEKAIDKQACTDYTISV